MDISLNYTTVAALYSLVYNNKTGAPLMNKWQATVSPNTRICGLNQNKLIQ